MVRGAYGAAFAVFGLTRWRFAIFYGVERLAQSRYGRCKFITGLASLQTTGIATKGRENGAPVARSRGFRASFLKG